MNRLGARWAGDTDDARRALAGWRRSAHARGAGGGGGAAGSDHSGGEDEAMEKKVVETERKRTREGRRAWFIKGDR